MKITGDGTKNSDMRFAMLVLFVVFNTAGVFLNYLLSWRIEEQAVGINLAGRQRMLSQRMVKVLLQIDNTRRQGESSHAYLEELKLTFDLFDNTLRGFDAGHETRGGAGEKLFLPSVTDIAARKAVGEAEGLWQDYRSKVVHLLQRGDGLDRVSLQSLLAEAQTRNLKLLDLMNTLTTRLEIQTKHETQRIRIYQAAVLLLALACFVWALVLFRRRDKEIIKAKEIAEEATRKLESYSAIKSYLVEVSTDLHQADSLSDFARRSMHHVTQGVNANYGAFYMVDEKSQHLIAIGGYGALATDLESVAIGQGLVGQCAQDKVPIVMTDPTDTSIRIVSGLGEATPKSIMLLPIVTQADQLLGVIVVGSLWPIDTEQQALLDAVRPMVAMNLELLRRNLGARRMVWGNQYRIGVQQIDDQHKELVGIFGMFSDAIQEKRGNEKLGKVLKELIDYAVYHFSSEEGLMQTHAYPESSAHLKEHEDLKNTVNDLQRKFKDGEATVTFETLQLLNDWLIHHIFNVDRHFALFLNARGIK